MVVRLLGKAHTFLKDALPFVPPKREQRAKLRVAVFVIFLAKNCRNKCRAGFILSGVLIQLYEVGAKSPAADLSSNAAVTKHATRTAIRAHRRHSFRAVVPWAEREASTGNNS